MASGRDSLAGKLLQGNVCFSFDGCGLQAHTKGLSLNLKELACQRIFA